VLKLDLIRIHLITFQSTESDFQSGVCCSSLPITRL